MSPQLSFDSIGVILAPLQHGIYELYDLTGTIYIGRAYGIGVTIRSRLQSHLSGDDGPCTATATGFAWELTSDPVARERQLLAEYEMLHGRLPKCNDRMP